MIDVLKRLSELDAQNPRVISQPKIIKQGVAESQVDECGMMPEMHMDSMKPSTPASINMTAGSADELGNLLKDIVSLAGLSHQDDHTEPMGDMPPPAEPEMGPPESGADAMRSTLDKLNPMAGDDEEGDEESGEEDDEEDADEGMDGPYDNSPTQANEPPSSDNDAMLNKGIHNQDPAGHPGAGDRMDGDRPKAFATFEDQLMYEYKKFVRG